MTAATATLDDVSLSDGQVLAFRAFDRAMRVVMAGFASVAAIGVFGAAVTIVAAWMVAAALSRHPHTHQMAMGALPRVTHSPMLAAANLNAPVVTSHLSLEAKVAQARALASELARTLPPEPVRPVEVVAIVSEPLPAPATKSVENIPLPRQHPAPPQSASPPQAPSAPQTAALAPPPAPEQKPAIAALPPHTTTTPLAGVDGRTAVYDISARTVYMPNGEKLEAHSGLGEKMDDPRHIRVRMRGPTPPNVYTLTMREKLFHGVRAIRLNPIDESKMFGRDGMLAHTYMLGPNGQSNGCVSFKNYDKFLRAFLNGEVDRMVVVAGLNGAPPAHVARMGRAPTGRFASAEQPFDRTDPQTW